MSLLPMPAGSAGALAFPSIWYGPKVPGPAPAPPPTIPLDRLLETKFRGAVVDLDLTRPSMFELRFWNGIDKEEAVEAKFQAFKATLRVGSTIKILAPDPDISNVTRPIIVGEVTSVEAICDVKGDVLIVFRGYDYSHRLQRVRRSQTFLMMPDSVIATKIAAEHKLLPDPTNIEMTETVNPHVSQVAQTDWDFLQERARINGFECGVELTAAGVPAFYFRNPLGTGPAGAAKATVKALKSVKLEFTNDLLMFRPRLSAANMPMTAQVRVWDPMAMTTTTSSSMIDTGATKLAYPADAEEVASTTFGIRIPGAADVPMSPYVGLTPPQDPNAFVMVNQPAGSGPTTTVNTTAAAGALAYHIGSAYAYAEGVATGKPGLVPGEIATVVGVPTPFDGSQWNITRTVHTFAYGRGQRGYTVKFYATGSHDRSLLGLATGGSQRPAPVQGMVCGIVTNVGDLMAQNRVKVSIPLLAPAYETDWAPVVQFAAGARSGACWLPEVGDQVLVGFELGDVRRPYVLGGVMNGHSAYPSRLTKVIGASGVPPVGPVEPERLPGAQVIRRGFVSSAGNKLAFLDVMPPPTPAPPMPPPIPPPVPTPLKTDIVLGTLDEGLVLKLDETLGAITLAANPKPPRSKNPRGSIEIDCSTAAAGGGDITINAGAAGTVEISGMDITITSMGTVKVEANADVTVESKGMVQVKGTMIKLG